MRAPGTSEDHLQSRNLRNNVETSWRRDCPKGDAIFSRRLLFRPCPGTHSWFTTTLERYCRAMFGDRKTTTDRNDVEVRIKEGNQGCFLSRTGETAELGREREEQGLWSMKTIGSERDQGEKEDVISSTPTTQDRFSARAPSRAISPKEPNQIVAATQTEQATLTKSSGNLRVTTLAIPRPVANLPRPSNILSSTTVHDLGVLESRCRLTTQRLMRVLTELLLCAA